MSRRTYKRAIAGLACLGVLIAVERPAAQEPQPDAGNCHGAVISALATSGLQPSDFGDVRALQDAVRSACAAVDTQGHRFTIEIDGVTVGGFIRIRLVLAD